MTVTEFLLARIAEDEAVARGSDGQQRWEPARREPRAPATVARWEVVSVEIDEYGFPDERIAELFIGGGQEQEQGTAEHIARHDPTRVLAECEAKRRIVLGMVPYGPIDDINAPEVLGLLALPYADHPDYDEAWRP